MIEQEKPPLGLAPIEFSIDYKNRYKDVCEAIKRYWDRNYEIPVNWIKEYNFLIRILKLKNVRNKEEV